MTDKDVAAHVEALLTGQPAKPFQASPQDADVLRAAVALRAGHPSGVAPDPWFVETLHRQLAAAARQPRPAQAPPEPRPWPLASLRRPEPTPSGQPRPGRPWWAPLGKAAAAAAIVASSVAAAVTAGHATPRPVAAAPAALNVRSAVLLASDGRPLGRAYAYSGNPSWVFMDVRHSDLTGGYVCELHLTNGTTTPAGMITVHNGTGDWAHTVQVQAGQIRQATLATPSGDAIANATFP